MKKKEKIYDVIVVGAGPAGSVAAGSLASNGNAVLLVDKDKFPRDKVCGDGLVGDSIRILRKIGLWDDIVEKCYKSEKTELFPFDNKSFVLNNPMYTLKRFEFDNLLKEWAVDKGAEFKVCKFTGETVQSKKSTGIKVLNSDKTEILNAKIVIFAMGCQPSSFVIQQVSGNISAKSDIIAVRGYCKADWDIEHAIAFFRKELNDGYIWIFPMGGNVYNVGCGTHKVKLNLKGILEDFLKSNKFTSKSKYKWITEPKGAFLKTGLCNLEYAVNGNTLLAGETLGSTYPFTGEGIGKALETGYLAGHLVDEAIKEDDFDKLNYYPDLLRQKILRSYRTYSTAEKMFGKKYIGKILFYYLCISKTVPKYISDIVSEKRHASDIKAFRIIYRLLSKFIKT